MNAHYGLSRKPAGLGGRWLVPLVPSFKAKADAKMRHLPKPPAEGGRLLDVGFGNGGFLKLATEMGWQAEGIDFDPKAVALAKARGLNVRCASAAGLSAQNEQFDIITLSHVIEHVHDPISLLKDSYRLLKPSGFLWIETPNIESFSAKRFEKNWRGLEPPRHLVLFNLPSMKSTLDKIGFVCINQKWSGMSSFSIYNASIALELNSSPSTLNGKMPNLESIIFEALDMMVSRKCYVTIISRKLAIPFNGGFNGL
ncbi:MAG: class I SAM-dependent methyltransferase [Moraxella osloensis]|nr:class I SAM-dependent methyltransferase [Moraxella osloensis]